MFKSIMAVSPDPLASVFPLTPQSASTSRAGLVPSLHVVVRYVSFSILQRIWDVVQPGERSWVCSAGASDKGRGSALKSRSWEQNGGTCPTAPIVSHFMKDDKAACQNCSILRCFELPIIDLMLGSLNKHPTLHRLQDK